MTYFPSPWKVIKGRAGNYFENILKGTRLGECHPQEKRTAETGMEKTSGKRIERGWLGLEPDPTVGS